MLKITITINKKKLQKVGEVLAAILMLAATTTMLLSLILGYASKLGL